ncbi:MAG: hypothetical protein ACI9OJ_005223, partial [Myxococcota bacterium]
MVGMTKPSLLTLTILLAAPTALAIPPNIPVQGRLSSAAGVGVDGTYELTVRLYASSDAVTAVYEETLSSVPVAAGHFHLSLGSVEDLDVSVFSTNSQLWVGVSVEDESELPRQPLGSVPYALAASVAHAIQCTGCVSTLALDPTVLASYARTDSPNTFSDLQTFSSGADFALNEALNFRFQVAATEPAQCSSNTVGLAWINTVTGTA